ncbi:hypothetical protein Gotri_002543 [Gossypium trilobum]|uniref:Uncharacterized protein n=1 Tax=Gossypium trilobum TaxID=34281 RepID=A0A7J9F8Y0_9ROSI|nr:hypothetical protein [Gossypium trilobum]
MTIPVSDTVVDVESLVASMENKMMGSQLRLSPDYCIFRTPTILARHSPNAYIPNCFAFGPFHRCQPNSKATEKIKVKYLRELLLRSSNPEAMLRECLNSVKEIKGKARDCYAGYIDLAEEEFLEMLVVDGCFIVELFRKDADVVAKEDDDPIFSMSCMLQFLNHDLILLENQIPWLVLQLLFDKTKASTETNSLVELALQFFRTMFSYENPINPSLFFEKEIKHILDLLRLSLVLPSEEVELYERKKQLNKQPSEWQPIPSATRLNEAGVKFRRVVNVKSILDIKYSNGVLEIPSLLIQETTETIFRNLISYEQCLPHCKPVFTSYAKIMDNLIDTPHDMEILCKRVVLDNWLSPEDATHFFNKLYNDTYVKDFYYADLCNQLNDHCRKWLPKWRAAYVHNYFSKPWAIAAQIYAIIILFLTVFQSFKK